MATAAPTLQKKRGAYYTPRPLADFLVGWAIRSGTDRVLDPSCGEAVFLESAVARIAELDAEVSPEQIVGFEIDDEAAASARVVAPQAAIFTTDFFSVDSEHEAFQAVIGNPPYIRYHHFTGSARVRAFEGMARHGVTLSELTSSWAPFVVHASAFLAPDGRLAFVLPMELLVTDYAAPIRSFLQSRFAHVDIITFEERVFPGAMVDAVLLLAEGSGPGTVRVHRLQNLSQLDSFDPNNGLRASEAKWSNALIDQSASSALASVSSHMQPLGAVASVDIGVVTGANRFFVVSDLVAKEWGLARTDLRQAVARAQHVPGAALTTEQWESLRQQGKPVWMFAPPQPNDAAWEYIRSGEAEHIDQAYKCRVRKQWWRLNLPQPPDLFLSYMSNRIPRMIENRAKALSTNLLHNVRLTSPNTSARWIAQSWINSATMLSCELSGRAYGGGVLKLETREAERVVTPVYDVASASRLEALRDQIEHLLSEQRFVDVAELIDPIVLADVPDAEIQLVRNAWLDLQRRRQRRTKDAGQIRS